MHLTLFLVLQILASTVRTKITIIRSILLFLCIGSTVNVFAGGVADPFYKQKAVCLFYFKQLNFTNEKNPLMSIEKTGLGNRRCEKYFLTLKELELSLAKCANSTGSELANTNYIP